MAARQEGGISTLVRSLRVWVAAVLVALSALYTIPSLNRPASAVTLSQGGFTTSATVSGAAAGINFEPGETVSITARVTSSTTRTMLVDVEIYSPTAMRLQQLAFDNEVLTAGVERTFPVVWTVPAGAATGGYTVKVGIYTPGFGQNPHWNDSAAFFTVGMGTAPPPGGPVRIMPLGDSLTDGFTVNGGYRIDLATMMASAGYSVDFVGSRWSGVPGLVDKNHEGHAGWRIDHLAQDVTTFLDAYEPRIVLLMLGTNDMAENHDVAGAPARLAALIDQIRVAVPDAVVIVSSLPRHANGDVLARIQAYNAQLPGIVASRGSTVRFVDAYASIDAVHLAPDGMHLTANGYGRLAEVWYAAVQPILADLSPTSTPTPTLTPTSTSTPAPSATPTSTATPMPGPCSPRPRVLLGLAVNSATTLLVTVTATGAGNGVQELQIGAARNASIEVAGQSGEGNFRVTLPGAPASVSLLVTRQRREEAVHVPLVVVDRCGDWHTFVGAGPRGF